MRVLRCCLSDGARKTRASVLTHFACEPLGGFK